MKQSLLFFALILFIPSLSLSQDTDFNETISVYLDCRGCNANFVRTEIQFINFVRDQADAEVHLLVTLQQTGSGGWEHTLNYMGMGIFNDQTKEIKFISPESDTNAMMRNRLVKYIKLGLVSFLTDKDILSSLNLSFTGIRSSAQKSNGKDPWNSWVFKIGASTNFSGEQTKKYNRMNGSFDARRITDKWKINFNYNQNYNRQVFTSIDDDGNENKDIYITENKNFFGLQALSLSDHWTVGAYQRVRSSTQNNIDLSVGATPSIEYSVFPYREYTRREITFRYGVLGSHYNYTEPTIYDKEEEFLWRQELNVRADFTQPWGGVYGWLDAGMYMHDLSKNRVNFGLQFNMKITRGLSMFFSARYSLINDQISLPAGDISEEERLLNLRQQPTSYTYGGSVGFEFNFGSIYNNVVNSRF
ncbi:MAG: hypothetical protein WD016_02620 [Balneolaceae bacterium]